MLTPEQVFIRVYKRLLDGTGRAVECDSGGNTCLYRDSANNKCAAGIFITEYDTNFEHRPVTDLPRGALEPMLDSSLSLLADLQKVHDYAGNWNGTTFIGHQSMYFLAKYALNKRAVINGSMLSLCPL